MTQIKFRIVLTNWMCRRCFTRNTRPIFFCDPVKTESVCDRTRANRLIKESHTTGGLRKNRTDKQPWTPLRSRLVAAAASGLSINLVPKVLTVESASSFPHPTRSSCIRMHACIVGSKCKSPPSYMSMPRKRTYVRTHPTIHLVSI